MTKLASALLLSLFLALGAAGAAGAADKAPAAADKGAKAAPARPAAAPAAAGKEVTLKGTLGCAKCGFKEGSACQNVLKVKEGGKEVSYALAKNGVSEENHEAVCGATKAATVTGTVSEEKGKKVLTASAIKFE